MYHRYFYSCRCLSVDLCILEPKVFSIKYILYEDNEMSLLVKMYAFTILVTEAMFMLVLAYKNVLISKNDYSDILS